ncbi:MAG: 2-oxoacid:ferredoxin oxidoreductase subunit beta [Candidatus Korarchaeota archaeon]|nr:2-oxoacid:ferredoxin oxidoreductase subunit beta [Candidatus Korarchaeota archaeon]NIU85273.1 2-oxoacid:ferredoxin oxidoreductase subunit beta [Candidatus Thorarchaeota archaeon]NIW15368.1 2-oxoacid:ferredoxin oxidoreductase subunit beta [Candidatus Thorarchaeota archaeon]NIW53317.1 2-oxoacid:ferredoxin oxidoreductase subunit beta [Candidatus Korarchaeota archaeon]
MRFETPAENTWCPGCGNFPLLVSARRAISELIEEGKIEQQNVVVISGIGCHGKITSYLELNSVHTAHGRVLPMALGTKLGNPNLRVIGFGGDGDTYDEGMAHFIHAARNNANFSFVVHDNKMFSLTTGQPTATTSRHKKTKSTPQGKPSSPINPLMLALAAGATFVGRGYSFHIDQSKELLKQAIMHDGFGFVDMIQPCVVYNDTRGFMNEHAYWMDPEPTTFREAVEKAREWDYNLEDDAKVPLGLFYRTKEPTFEENWPSLQPWYKLKRDVTGKELFKEFK